MTRKPYEDDDPMELVAVALPEGSVDETAEAMVEEFVKMGLDDETILQLFKTPVYRGTYRVYRERGEVYVRTLIRKVRGKWGFPRFTTQEV